MPDQLLQILVIEDDQLDQKIMKRSLLASGIKHELHFAEDHESGLFATNEREYDCIFMDYNLPGGTGLELLKEIRNSGNTSPIIIVTSQGDEKLAVDAMKNGANDYIPKDHLTGDGIAQIVRHTIGMNAKEKEKRALENQLKETQKQLNTVVSNAPIILFAIDDQQTIKLIEGRGMKLSGIEKENFINTKLSRETNLPVSYDLIQNALSDEEFVDVIEWQDKFFEVFYSPVKNNSGEVNGVMGVASDVTAHKNIQLELEKAKAIAEDTAKLKEQFLANMSHEIRTPMNGIIGLTGILLGSPMNEEQQHYLHLIKTCSDNLLVIINDILDISKIEAGKMNLEKVPFDIKQTAINTIELFKSKADEKSLQLITEIDEMIPDSICGDPTRISQVLNNLVSNAIKFTEKGSVKIILKVAQISSERVTLTCEISDTGIGIPQKSLSSVFDSFTQASSDTTRKFGGTGLGLTIVKRLIELQGGEIGITSKEGLGTTFHFTLTFEILDSQTTGIIKSNDISESVSHLHILVAEDNPVNQLIVRKIFAAWNTTVDFASNGKEAIEKVKQSTYDVILMDVQMPEMDGHSATAYIRNEMKEPARSIPIIAMTAHASSIEKQKCLNSGMSEYISKPFEPLDLKKKILEQTKSVRPSLNAIVSYPKETQEVKLNNLKSGLKIKESTITGTSPNSDAAKGIILSENKIDLAYLKQIADGSDSFIIEMIEMFLNKTPLALEQMEECFRKQNWEELKQIAHRIKPSFAYIGMPEIQSALGKIESLSENQSDPEQVTMLLQKVRTGSNSAFEQLKVELGQLK